MKFIFLICIGISFSAFAGHITKPKPAQLQFSVDFIFKQVLIRKNKDLLPQIALPKIFVESKTSLAQFQDALTPQWGSKPDAFTNAYAIAKTEIFIIDEAAYYKRNNRCMDDSLAHELTHYIQDKYQHFDLNDEMLEMDAIDVQTWFRENFCKLTNN